MKPSVHCSYVGLEKDAIQNTVTVSYSCKDTEWAQKREHEETIQPTDLSAKAHFI